MEIKNEHQYHITKAWAERFALAIDKLQEMDPLLMKNINKILVRKNHNKSQRKNIRYKKND